MLKIKNLHVFVEGKEIIRGLSLSIKPGEVHAIMGPNGSGKSTLSQALMGYSSYIVNKKDSKIMVDGTDIIGLKPDERAKAGLFLAFQNPIAVPGVSVGNFLKTAFQSLHSANSQKPTAKSRPSVWEFNQMLVAKAKELSIPREFLGRSVNDGFSGGEKKKIEMLQATVLAPKYAIFDEIDTGLDIDALKVVAGGIKKLLEQKTGIIIITHYQRILKYIKPDYIHILIGGRITKTSDASLGDELEKKGYAAFNSG